MLRRLRREPAAPAGSAVQAPTPSTPVEVGLLLRMVRERSGMGLDEIRDRIGVARVDIEAIEQGRLEALHVEQAAVVALTRYAELLGKDPGPYLDVLRRHWPRPATALDAVRTISTGETPVAHLATATRILSRLADRSSAPGLSMGLGETLRRELERSSGGAARAIAALGPAVNRARRAPALPGGERPGALGAPQALPSGAPPAPPAPPGSPGSPSSSGQAPASFPRPSLPSSLPQAPSEEGAPPEGRAPLKPDDSPDAPPDAPPDDSPDAPADAHGPPEGPEIPEAPAPPASPGPISFEPPPAPPPPPPPPPPPAAPSGSAAPSGWAEAPVAPGPGEATGRTEAMDGDGGGSGADLPAVAGRASKPVSAGRSVTRFLAERFGLDRPLDEVGNNLATPAVEGGSASGLRARE